VHAHRPEAQLWSWARHLTTLLETDEKFSRTAVASDIAADGQSEPLTRFVGAKHITEKLESKPVVVKWDGVGGENLPPLTHYYSVERWAMSRWTV